VKLQKYWNFTN